MKKRLLAFLLIVSTLISTFSGLYTVGADGEYSEAPDEEKTYSEGLEYWENSSGSYIVAGIGTCTDTEIVIPSVFNSKPVVGIDNSAFSACTGLTSITIPDSVTSIKYGAFYYCTGLTSITIPDSVTSIGQCAFEGCTGLTSITIPDSVTSIEYKAFCNCTGLTSITIPDSVTSIGQCAFEGCTGLTSITIPDSVTHIGQFAFEGCTGLTSITIPDSVTSIEYAAFPGCTGLTSITIPDSVTSIGGCAFQNCTGLTSITIPDSVTSIGDYAFQGCSGLTSITIPDSVTSIGSGAFCGCTGLTSITIPDSVTSIEYQAFRYCTGLTSITIPDSVTSIGPYAFQSCYGLTSITIPDSVTSLSEYCFRYCLKLRTICYDGTMSQWSNITKDYYAFYDTPSDIVIICTDGTVDINGNTVETPTEPEDPVDPEEPVNPENPTDPDALDAEEMKRTEHCVPLNGCNQAVGGFTRDTVNKRAGSACLSFDFNGNFIGGLSIPDPIDAFGMNFLEFEIYISDIEKLNLLHEFELGINSSNYVQSWDVVSYLRNGTNGPAVSGWNHIVIPLSGGGKTDLLGITGLRLVTSSSSGLTVKFDNIRLTDCYEMRLSTDEFLDMVNGIPEPTEENYDSVADDVNSCFYAYNNRLFGEDFANVPASALKTLYDKQAALETVICPDYIYFIKDPYDTTIQAGETANFYVSVCGNGLVYRWQYYNGNFNWVDYTGPGADTSMISVPGTAKYNEKTFRCMVADNRGEIIISQSARLTVEGAEPEEQVYASATITSMPKTRYQPGEAIDLTGLELEVSYSNERPCSHVTADMIVCTVTVANSAPGTQTIPFSYTDQDGITASASFDILIEEAEPEVVISPVSASVKTLPAKTSYQPGEAINLTGLTAKITYSDGSSLDVTADKLVCTVAAAGTTAGTVTIPFSYTEAGVTVSSSFEITVIAEVPHTVFSAAGALGNRGDTLKVILSVTGDTPVNGLLLHTMTYDTSALEFLGFDEYGDLINNSMMEENSLTNLNGKIILNLAYQEAVVPNGPICSLLFRVKDDAPFDEYAIGFSTVASSASGSAVTTAYEPAVLTVTDWVPGDFDGDGEITLNDAVYFIGWINYPYLPDLYPMPYGGNLDFNGDGTIDLNDAVYFIGWVNYPYLPDAYTINW